jgi:Na+/melibiose symporter-like transporter
MEPGSLAERCTGVQTIKAILSALGVVAVIFGVPVMVTLVAGQFGLAYRLIGWVTLLGMMVVAFQSRSLLARLLLGERKLAPALSRRPYKRR